MYFRYSRWDGTQSFDDLDPEKLMEALSDDLISDGDIWNALRRMMRWGDEGRLDDQQLAGLQELIERLRERRQQELERWNLNSVMDDITKALEEIVQAERAGIQRRLDQQLGRQPQQQPGQQPQSEQQAGQDQAGEDQAGGQDGQQSGQQQPGQQSAAGQRQMGGQPVGGQPGRPGLPQSGRQQAGQPQSGEMGNQGGEPGDQPPSGAQPSTPDANDPFRKLLEQIAQRKQQYLDELPRDPGGQIQKLSDYEFMDDTAREKFQELLQKLQQQMMEQYFQGMKQAIQNLTPENLDAIREMVKDLNKMLEERAQGGNPDFQAFKDKHGQFFPPDINSLDELIEHLQKQQAQMQSLLNSMSPEQRQQLQSMMDNLFRDDRLKWDLARLAANLAQFPQPGQRTQFPFRGDESLSMEQALRVMERLQNMDQLESQLRRAQDVPNLDQVDPNLVRELMGEQSAQDVERLKQLTKVLEEAGYLQRNGEKLELTPRGMRKIGQKALEDIFAHLKRDRFGKHAIDQRGAGGERIDETKRYEFGDPFLLDLERTLMNAVHREGIGSPVRLRPDDFDVYRTEQLTQTSTVLMLDMSRSMILRGCFFAAKKVALALNSLIRGQFPRDNLYILGFSYYANQIKPEQLTQITWDAYEYGTNMQHGFMIARQLLARHKGGNRQIIMITDGEPTAHIEPGTTRPIFNYPPTPRTFQETLREVVRCTREGITINTFMLERGHYLTSFVNQMTKINKGRAFFSTPERLGEYILVDYVANKRKLMD